MADDTNEVYISMSASDVIKGAASPAKSAAHDVSKRKTSAIPTPAGTSSPRNKVHEERVPERRQLPVREVYHSSEVLNNNRNNPRYSNSPSGVSRHISGSSNRPVRPVSKERIHADDESNYEGDRQNRAARN